MPAAPATVSYDLACLLKNGFDQISKQLEDIRKSSMIGLAVVRSQRYTVGGDGSPELILPIDISGRARRVVVIAASRTDVGDCVLALGFDSSIAPETGPVFATGTSHDFGIVPGGVELYASQKPVTGATASDLLLWVLTYL